VRDLASHFGSTILNGEQFLSVPLKNLIHDLMEETANAKTSKTDKKFYSENVVIFR
jgi:hypothetical protein